MRVAGVSGRSQTASSRSANERVDRPVSSRFPADDATKLRSRYDLYDSGIAFSEPPAGCLC